MKVSNVVSILRRTNIFGGVHDDALNVLAFNGSQSHHNAGEVLVEQGAKTRRAMVVLSGDVEVRAGGKSSAVAGGPGTMVGELALLAERDALATVTTSSECEILEIDQDLFGRVVSEFPEIASTLHQQLANRLASLVNDLAGLEAHLRLEPVSAKSRQIQPS